MGQYQHPYIALAKNSILYFLKRQKKLPCPPNLTQDMKEKAGAFVSIKKRDQLRGCIGTLLPQEENLAKEIIENAIRAACYDPRFSPVTPDELGDLSFSIDVISPLEKVEDLSELDPKVYGLVVKSGGKQGVLLPNLNGVRTVEDQIRICRAKGGIDEDEPQEYYRFKVHRFG